jgi:hypothetical protein
MDSGEQKIDDEAEAKRVRAQARKVIVRSVVIAALVTAALLAVP